MQIASIMRMPGLACCLPICGSRSCSQDRFYWEVRDGDYCSPPSAGCLLARTSSVHSTLRNLSWHRMMKGVDFSMLSKMQGCENTQKKRTATLCVLLIFKMLILLSKAPGSIFLWKKKSFGCRAPGLLKASKKDVLMKDDTVQGRHQLPQLTSLLRVPGAATRPTAQE